MQEIEYLWQHWKFNADQRLRAFNFFVVLSVFANGGLFSAYDKGVHPLMLSLIAVFIAILSVVFWMMDARSKILLHLSVPAIQAFESSALTPAARLFHRDIPNTKGVIRYTFAFRILFIAQLVFAISVIFYGIAATFLCCHKC